MSIPQAVQRQGERSDALLKAHFAPPAAVEPVVAAPAVEASSPPVEPVSSAPVAVAPTGDAAPAKPVDDEPKRVDWKQKYLVLEGKYRAEVPRYAADLRDARQKILDLTNKNLSLHEDNDKLRRTAPAATPAGDAPSENDFDPALIAAIRESARKAAETAVSTAVAPHVDRNAEQERSAAALAHENFQRDVNDYLMDSHNTGWREIDTKPEFHAYLADRDPMSGAQRQTLLNDAVKNADSLRAAAIFQDFLNRTNQPVRPVAAAVPAVDPRAHLATPARGSSGAPVAEPEKRTYSRQEVAEFYSGYARAVVKPGITKAEIDRMKSIDQDIQFAMNEGRIR